MQTERTELLEYREQIDEIDKEIIRLFESRMKVSERVAAFKIKNGMKVLDPAREQQKLNEVSEKADSAFNALGEKELFRQIMAISRKRQYQMLTEAGFSENEGITFVDRLPLENVRVVFQGLEGAYSYAAMREYFPPDIKSYHVRTWRDAMEEVSLGRADYAVLPIENSTAGIVGDIYDLLMDYELHIVGEQVIQVRHVLLGLPGADLSSITKVISHPQGLAQCRAYLESHPEWEEEKYVNTAGAAKKVSEDQDIRQAAIASREAGEVYGLSVLAENICSSQENSTRFIIVSRLPVYQKGASRVGVCFELPHESGSLYNMISHINYNSLNMTRIESRPVPGKTWEYRFFVDFEGSLTDSAVICALRGLEAEALKLRILGNY